jgi:hypothetical protein
MGPRSLLAAGTGPSVLSNTLVDLDHGSAFPQNKQNEPSITRDPQSGVLIAGANDEFAQPLCAGTTAALTSPCPFRAGVPTSAYYRSTNNGNSWAGGYLPGFETIGRTSGGDPSLDWGPRRCSNGTFNIVCGVVVYYASLADPYADAVGGEQVTLSRSYDDAQTWSNPVQATSTDNKSNFDDHEWVAVDHTPGSAHYGRVYLNWAVFCYSCAGNGNTKLYVAHSDDEGRTWSRAVQVSASNSNIPHGSRETGQMAVASNGTVEVFWTENADATNYPSLQVVATSIDGGETFSAPVTIATVNDYPVSGTPFDVVDLYNRVPGMSARVDCYPHPAADPSSNKVYVVWCDFSGNSDVLSRHGVIKAAVSTDGQTWTQLGTIGSVSGRNAFFPQASVSSGGTVSVTFDALTEPAADPWATGTQVYDNYYTELTSGAGSFSPPLQVSTQSSNPDGSSYNNLKEQFLGDYIGVVDGPTSAFLVWTDARAAAPCAAVDTYRNAVYAGSKTAVAPNPDTVCATPFGNTDTEMAQVNL